MTQLFNDFRDMVNDRFRSPFWISTAISWFIWNWKVTVTALFSPELLTVDFLESYLENTSAWYHLFVPLLSGAIYSIFSASFKESLEILAKAVRSKISMIDNSGILYKSISITEHNKKVSRLERTIKRIELERIETDEIQAKNDELFRSLDELDQRDRELVSIIDEQVLKQDLDDEFKKLRFLQKIHNLNFAKTLTEDEIPKAKAKDRNTENTKKTETNTEAKKALEKIIEQQSKSAPHHMKGTPTLITAKDGEVKISFSDSLAKEIKTYENNSLKDPFSYKTILLVLLQIKSSRSLESTLDPSLMGLSEDVFYKCINNGVKSGLIKKSGEGYTITQDGLSRLESLLDHFSQDRICKILHKFYERTKVTILNLLSSRALTLNQIIEETPYHPQLIDAIQDLTKSKHINKQGELYFTGSLGNK